MTGLVWVATLNTPAVLIDRERRTAIVVRRGRKLTYAVPLEEGELMVRAFTPEQIRAREFRPLDYPVRRAVRLYLRHSGGVSKRARQALRGVLS